MLQERTQYTSRKTMTFSDFRDGFERDAVGSIDAVDTFPSGGAAYYDALNGAIEWITDTTFYRDTLIALNGTSF